MFRQTTNPKGFYDWVNSLQWRAEHMFRQTWPRLSKGTKSAVLQWRAEHMFRQTRRMPRLHQPARRASMEGGTYVPPN